MLPISVGSLAALGPEEEEKVLLLLELGLRVVERVETVVPEGRREEAVIAFCEAGALAVLVAEGLKNEVRAAVEAAMDGERPGDIMALEPPDAGPRYIWFTSGAPARGISDCERRWELELRFDWEGARGTLGAVVGFSMGVAGGFSGSGEPSEEGTLCWLKM